MVSSRPCSRSDVSGRRATHPSLDASELGVSYPVMEVEDLGPRPDQVLEAHQARTLVLNALERVPLARRAVLIMHDIDELPMTEIASRLSIYRFAGYSRLRKARKEFAAAVPSLLRGVLLRGARKP